MIAHYASWLLVKFLERVFYLFVGVFIVVVGICSPRLARHILEEGIKDFPPYLDDKEDEDE